MAEYDLLLKGGVVVDGTRSQRYLSSSACRRRSLTISRAANGGESNVRGDTAGWSSTAR